MTGGYSMKKKRIFSGLFTIAGFAWCFALVPSVNQDYINDIRIPRTLDWSDNNAAFALAGLSAPANVTNFYDYGRKRMIAEAHELEAVRKEHKLGPAYNIPPIENTSQPNTGADIRVKDDDIGYYTCLSQVPQKVQDKKNCASEAELADWIADNKIIWDRFNTMTTMQKFSAIPMFFPFNDNSKKGYHGRDLITLARIQNAAIIQMARENPDAAYTKWRQQNILLRAIISDNTTTLDKMIFMVLMNMNIGTFERLLYEQPEIARTYSDDIEKALKPQGTQLLSAKTMLFDDWRITEPTVYDAITSSMGPFTRIASKYFNVVNGGILNDMHQCMQDIHTAMELSTDKFSLSEEIVNQDIETCKQFEFDPYAGFKRPGLPNTNVALNMMVGSALSWNPIIEDIHKQDARMRMAIIAKRIVATGLPDSQIADILRRMPNELQSPYKKSPFLWDPEKRRIYYQVIFNGEVSYDEEFYLPAVAEQSL